MATLDLAKLKTIDKEITDTVFGFIHECELLFDEDNLHHTIPDLIGYICLAYYFINEYFSVYGENITYDQLTNAVKNHCTEIVPNTAYGNVRVDGNNSDISVYIWTLKIISNAYSVCIGIDASNKMYPDHDFTNVETDDYDHNTRYFAYGEEIFWSSDDVEASYGVDIDFADNDIIKYTVNVKKQKITIFNDRIDDRIVYDVKDGFFNGCIFHFAVMLHDSGDAVQMIDFECH